MPAPWRAAGVTAGPGLLPHGEKQGSSLQPVAGNLCLLQSAGKCLLKNRVSLGWSPGVGGAAFIPEAPGEKPFPRLLHLLGAACHPWLVDPSSFSSQQSSLLKSLSLTSASTVTPLSLTLTLLPASPPVRMLVMTLDPPGQMPGNLPSQTLQLNCLCTAPVLCKAPCSQAPEIGMWTSSGDHHSADRTQWAGDTVPPVFSAGSQV